MKIKEYILVLEEAGGMMRIKGQFMVPSKKGYNLDKDIVAGRALNDCKAGDIVMIQIRGIK